MPHSAREQHDGTAAERRPLLVVALGGNAISTPRGPLAFGVERGLIRDAVMELAPLARAGARLLIVHGNGPQVGRLLAAVGVGDAESLDVHVAQTQGELGYLLTSALDAALGMAASVALVTRVVVGADDPAFTRPTKPVGAVLSSPPSGVPSLPTADGTGWRRVVASPRPQAVVEMAAIAQLLRTQHVVAGGGGGVALMARGTALQPCAAVIDKDWVAAKLAIALEAERLLFVTDVTHAFDRFGNVDQAAIETMTVSDARQRLAAGAFAPGSMAPKIESAVEFVEATGRAAVIATLGQIGAALKGEVGTTVRAD
jgi:carbamate kinase